MAFRLQPRRKFWRDVPMAIVFVGWIALAGAMSLSFYYVDWPATWRSFSGTQPPQQLRSKADDDRIYTGSILVPERRNRCWQYGFDNRSGTVWNIGSVDCYEASLQYAQEKKAKGLGEERLRSIQKSLGHGGN